MRSYLVNIKRYDYLIASICYFLVALFILNRILFSSPGTIGFFHDWPIGPYPEMNRSYANGGLYVWDSQIGNIFFPTDSIYKNRSRAYLLSYRIFAESIYSCFLSERQKRGQEK